MVKGSFILNQNHNLKQKEEEKEKEEGEFEIDPYAGTDIDQSQIGTNDGSRY